MRFFMPLVTAAAVAVLASTSAATPPTKPPERPLVTPIRPGDTFITRFDPPKAVAGWGQKVTLYGGGLGSCPHYKVFFSEGLSGAKPNVAATPTARIDTAIDLSGVPLNARTGKVAFVCEDTQKTVLSAVDFVVPDIRLEELHSPEPPGVITMTSARGSRLTLHGPGLSQWDSLEVRFQQLASWPAGSAVPVPATHVTMSSMDVVVPDYASTGVLEITGSLTRGGNKVVRTRGSLQVMLPRVAVTGFDAQGIQPGANFAVNGSGFLNEAEASAFVTGADGTTSLAAQITSRKDTQMTLVLPATAKTGPVRVVIGTGAAAKTATSSASLQVLAPM